MGVLLWRPTAIDLSGVWKNPSQESYFSVLAFSFIGSLGLSVMGTYFLYSLGVVLSRWHILLLLLPFYLLPILAGCRAWKKIFLLGSLNLSVLVITTAICSGFRDLGGDGMATHQESILTLSCEWNPQKDPYFLKGSDLSSRYPELVDSHWIGRGISRSTAYLISGIINKATDRQEAGKALHLLSLWMVFLSAMAFAEHVFHRRRNQYLFAFLAALNPVVLYQCLSYWQDGFLAGVYTSLVFVGICWFFEPRKLENCFNLIVLCFILSGLKKAGVGYAGITCLGIFGAQLFYRKIKARWFFTFGTVLLFLIVLGGTLPGIWVFSKNLANSLNEKIAIYQSEEVNDGGSTYNQNTELYHQNRWVVFFISAFTESRAVAQTTHWKNPYSISKTELQTFYHFFEDPRSGGYGPLYGGIFILGVFLFIMSARSHSKCTWFSLIVVFFLSLPLAVVPTYWARWIPQMWLVPLFLLLPTWISKEDRAGNGHLLFSIKTGFRQLGLPITIVLCLLNAVVIVVPYFIGNLFASYVIRQQLEVVDSLDQPLKYGIGYYTSNRKWIIDRGLEYEATWEPKDWQLQHIQFYRTNTKIFLTPEDLNKPFRDNLSIEDRLNEIKELVQRWQPNQWFNEVWIKVPSTEESIS